MMRPGHSESSWSTFYSVVLPRTCSVEVGEAAKAKKTILQTEQQMGRSPVWDSKAQATLFQSDVLQSLGKIWKDGTE